MSPKHRPTLLILAAACVGATATRAQQMPAPEPTPSMPIPEYIQRVVASDEQRREHRQAMECDKTIKTERLDDHDKVTSTRTVRLVGGDSKELSYSANVEAKQDAGSDASGRGGKPGKDEETVKAQQLVAIMNLRKLSPRYIFAFAGNAVLNGRDCHVFSYRPKPNQPAATREEKVVNNLQGRYWIDRNTFEIIQIDGVLASAVSVALIASVTRMDFKFHSQTLSNGEIGPADFSVNLAVKAPFYDFRQRQTTTMENWRLRHR